MHAWDVRMHDGHGGHEGATWCLSFVVRGGGGMLVVVDDQDHDHDE